MRTILSIGSLAVVAAAASGLWAGENVPNSEPSAKPEWVADTETINFFLPGQFKEALAKAKESQRCLMVKGVAFGIDDEGATCATKGHW